MKACRCDRCGKFYLPNYHHVTIAVDKWGGLNWDHLDLCNNCQGELEEWLNEKGDTNESNI